MRYLMHALRHHEDYEWWQLRPWQQHSAVLLVAGLVYCAIGLVYIFLPPSTQQGATLGWILDTIPLSAWGVLWLLVGLLALLSTRWPPASKTWGYSTLSGLATCWALLFAVGIILGDAPGQSLVGVLIWLLVAFLWYAIARLKNPDDPSELHRAIVEGLGLEEEV